MERTIERILFASRWLLAPLYLGLALALAVIAIKFFQELVHMFLVVLQVPDRDLILTLLALVDLVLVGSLLVMVMISGYENFVSRIDPEVTAERLSWFGKLDSGTLKIKVAAAIVAISSIHLLRAFMNATELPNDKLLWYVVMHLTFVVSAVMLGLLDRLVFAEHRRHQHSEAEV